MRLLLDTHIALWYVLGDRRLPAKARDLIHGGARSVHYSVVSVWEIAIKHGIAPKKMPISDEKFCTYADSLGFGFVPLARRHIAALKTLRLEQGAKEHHDPFDRMLICQAKVEDDFRLLTHDALLQGHEEPCVLLV